MLAALLTLQATQALAAPQGAAAPETVLAKQGPVAILVKDYSPFVPASSGADAGARITGAARIDTIDWSARTARFSVGGVSSGAGEPSGKLALQLWFLDAPYSGGALIGHKVAHFDLPENCTGGCSSISTGAVAMTPPSSGRYYPAVALVAHDAGRCGAAGAGVCTIDAVALADPEDVPPVVASANAQLGSSPVALGPVEIGGTPGTVTFHFSTNTVDLTLGSVTNTRTGESGTIRILVELGNMQYVADQSYNGYQIASTSLPSKCTNANGQLAASTVCSDISITGLAAKFPAAGTYYGSVLVEEYDDSTAACAAADHFCVEDGVNLQMQVTVPAPVSSSGSGSGGSDDSGDSDSDSGGGGAIDGTTVMLAAALILLRLTARRAPKGDAPAKDSSAA